MYTINYNNYVKTIKYFRSDKDDRFQLYLDKTFNKTASLMANSCKSVAILASENHSDKSIIVSSDLE